MNHSSKKAGFLQAAGLVAYVSLFAFAGSTVLDWFMLQGIEPGPIMGRSIFLLAFVISVAVCGSIFFGYPFVLFSRNKIAEAVQTVLWALCWLAIFFVVLLVLTILLS